jgi:uncharacterized protein (DUF433 family)
MFYVGDVREMKARFPLIAFTADTVAPLTGLSVRQLHRWDRTGFFVPSFADPNRRRPHSRVYSFADVVGLRTIARLRQQGVSFPDLKKVRTFFALDTNEDWANRRFYVVGNHVFFTHDEAVLAAKPLGQRVDRNILDLGPILGEVKEAIRQLPSRSPDQIGEITTDRFIMGGAPILAGTRIPTATVAWFARNGYGVDDIIREFPRLLPDDIQAALDWEHAQREEGQALATAVG